MKIIRESEPRDAINVPSRSYPLKDNFPLNINGKRYDYTDFIYFMSKLILETNLMFASDVAYDNQNYRDYQIIKKICSNPEIMDRLYKQTNALVSDDICVYVDDKIMPIIWDTVTEVARKEDL